MTVSIPKTIKKVAVLMGGTAAEREISLNSGNAVLTALQKTDLKVEVFDPEMKTVSAESNQNRRTRFDFLSPNTNYTAEVCGVTRRKECGRRNNHTRTNYNSNHGRGRKSCRGSTGSRSAV